MMITESCWVYPLAYEAEAPFLVAAYGGLTGVGPYYWFSADTPGYCLDPYFPWHNFPDGQKGVFKWSLHPGTQTQFPAAALMFARTTFAATPPVLHEERPLADLWDRKTPLLWEGRSFDPNRMTSFAEGAEQGAIDPLAFLVGRIEVKYGGDASKTTSIDLAKYINPKTKTVTSVTGELKFNYGVGLCTLDAPEGRGGRLLRRRRRCGEVTDAVIRSGNRYATVTLVPLDDKPLRVGEGAGAGRHHHAPERMDDAGGDCPRQGRKGGVSGGADRQYGQDALARRQHRRDRGASQRRLMKASQLDANGYRLREVASKSEDGSIVVKLPGDCLYAILER